MGCACETDVGLATVGNLLEDLYMCTEDEACIPRHGDRSALACLRELSAPSCGARSGDCTGVGVHASSSRRHSSRRRSSKVRSSSRPAARRRALPTRARSGSLRRAAAREPPGAWPSPATLRSPSARPRAARPPLPAPGAFARGSPRSPRPPSCAFAATHGAAEPQAARAARLKLAPGQAVCARRPSAPTLAAVRARALERARLPERPHQQPETARRVRASLEAEVIADLPQRDRLGPRAVVALCALARRQHEVLRDPVKAPGLGARGV